ncbi:hypothetical protein HK104_007615 [Borealophlyctis nickersoniae]|nr:hypothetical protein HK104_007615 [Borealophlyctis nickersoniae]
MGNICSSDRERDRKRDVSATPEPPKPSESPAGEPDFQFADGRRFLSKFDPLSPNTEQNDLIYTLPNDDNEMDRLHLQHYMLRYAFQGNYCAPVTKTLRKRGAKVLDVGTGSGIWPMEMATDFPDAEVTGSDLSPVQPTTIKPRNLEFTVHDITQPLPYPSGVFDFVRMRFLLAGIKKDLWGPIITELARVVKPGGYLELCEFVPGFSSKKEMPVTSKLVDQSKGADLEIAFKLKDYLDDCRLLQNAREVPKAIPASIHRNEPHLDRLAALVREDFYGLGQSMKPMVVSQGKITPEDFDNMLKVSQNELKVSGTTWDIYVAYARRV